MKNKRDDLMKKKIVIFVICFIIMNIPVYIYRWYWFGAIDYVSSEKTYNINGVTITLPWGWYNPFNEHDQSKYPISFIDFSHETLAAFGNAANEETKNRFSEVVEEYVNGNRKFCLTGTIYDYDGLMFVAESKDKMLAYIYIIDIGLEIYLISDKHISYYQFGRRAGAIIKNIRRDESKITVPFDLSEDKERALQNICMPIIKWGNAEEWEELDQAKPIDRN